MCSILLSLTHSVGNVFHAAVTHMRRIEQHVMQDHPEDIPDDAVQRIARCLLIDKKVT